MENSNNQWTYNQPVIAGKPLLSGDQIIGDIALALEKADSFVEKANQWATTSYSHKKWVREREERKGWRNLAAIAVRLGVAGGFTNLQLGAAARMISYYMKMEELFMEAEMMEIVLKY